MRYLRYLLVVFLLGVVPASAQITVPYVFSPGQTIRSSEVNSDLALFADALNRTGGTMTGSLTVNNVLPEADNTRDLGSAALSFNDAWFDGVATILTLTVTGSTTLGDAAADTITVNGVFASALLPNADNTLDIGSAGASWNDAWIEGTLTAGTVSITTLTCTGCVGATQLAATTVTAAAYGSASGVATFTVDADGRLTTAATTSIAIAATQVTSGNYVATVTAGSGIAVGTGTGTGSTPAFSLTALTADWSQTGAYDLVLANAGSELKMLESVVGLYYGIFDVDNLAADRTYTFPDVSGTMVTTGDTGSVTGTMILNDTVALTTDTSGNYVASLTGGNGVSVGAAAEGGTPAIALAALTGDWLQTGAYHIVQVHQDSSIKIKESTGDTYYGVLDVGDLGAADATYTFSGLSGTVLTSVTTAGGDVSGTYAALVVANDSHDHTATTVSGLGTADFTSANISQWTNDSVYITSAGTATNFSGSLAGDVTGTQGLTVVGNDSHTHDAGNLTGATLVSGVTASSLTSVGTLTALTVSGTLTLSGTAANIALGSNYLSGDGGDEGINVNSTGEVGIAVAAQVSDKLYSLASGAQTANFTAAGFFSNTSTNTTTDEISKYGLRINSSGTFTGSGGVSTTAYGLTAAASGADVNWAAVFTGDVSITGVLTVTGTTNSVGTITSGVWNAGAVTSSGVLTVNGFGTHSFSAGGTGVNLLSVRNTTDGTGNFAGITIGNSAASDRLRLLVFAPSFTPSGPDLADGVRLDNLAGAGGISISATHASGAIRLYAGGTTRRMLIDTTGVVTMDYYGAGTATFSAAGVISSVSDERLKTDIAPLGYGLVEVLALNPIRHRWSEASGLDDPQHTEYGGFSAQNVQSVMPLAVGVDGGGHLTLAERPILGATVNAVKTLNARIVELEKQVATLQEKIH